MRTALRKGQAIAQLDPHDYQVALRGSYKGAQALEAYHHKLAKAELAFRQDKRLLTQRDCQRQFRPCDHGYERSASRR
ncbi:hypothetical protein O9929_27425 [Vibrio lentus]|nr:hypothetical protein [Vibrio lentus]